MKNSVSVWRGGVFWRCAAAAALMAAMPACADEAKDAAQEKVGEALGWKPMPGRNYRPYRSGSVFAVASEPAQWPAAFEQATAWAAAGPAFEENPAEYVFRRLTLVQAAALGATDGKVAEALKAERRALAERAKQMRSMKTDDNQSWQMRNAANQLQQLDQKLGQWLADSPEERVAAFREEMDSYKPADRAVIAARYGGEERLAELIKLGKEYTRLMTAYREAEQNTTLPEPERKLAIRKASGALGYFYGFNGNERDYHAAMQDPDLSAEFGANSPMDHRSLTVPDLVVWAGEEEAAKLIAEAYALPVRIQLRSTGRTPELARELLIDGVLKPSRVPWSLAGWRGETVSRAAARDVVEVYDALKTSFPDLLEQAADNSDWNRNSALAAMAYALAILDRKDEAAALLALVGPDASGLPYHAKITPGAARSMWELVAGNADGARGWEQLRGLAGPANRWAELAAYAAKQADGSAAGSEAAKLWRARQGWALIGDGKVDEGLAVIEPVLEMRPAAGEKQWTQEWSEGAGRLLLLAKATERPELAKTWAEKFTADLKNTKGPAWRNDGLFDAYAKQQLAAGKAAEIEALLRARIEAAGKPKKRNVFNMGDSSGGEDERPADLKQTTTQLADVIGRQGRHGEVLALLAESSNWGQADLAQSINHGSSAPWRPLALVAADSLQASGKMDEATKVLEALLIARPGYDPAYALYTKIRGQEAAPFLEKLQAADRFEERPLIWLASLQLAAGDIAKAEATVGRAIATDPSDGEQPKGDRMRAYAVLREVALKKGDEKQAEFLAGVLAAIRRSEDADDLAEAGLTARAIEEYQLALKSFADAYCIQSRLARTLAEQGREAEAAEHYKRAFELMPDSFGRVESHCFGCEQAFAGEEAQKIAERVFTEMAAKADAKPQVYYLLGYLRMEQNRWDEAAAHFKRATEADPDYLNAWKKLASVLPNTRVPRAEQDRVAFKLIALDPSGRRGSGDAAEVRDLPALWRAYAAAGEAGLAVPTQVFPLGDKAKRAKTNDDGEIDDFMHDGMGKRPQTPAGRLAEHGVLRAITQALDQTYSWKARMD